MGIKLTEYVAPVAVNPYTEDVKELIAANEKNPLLAWELIVPIEDYQKTKYKVSTAAIEQGKTASYLLEEESKDGKTVRFLIRSKAKVKSGPRGPRGPRKGGTVANADAVSPTGE